MHNSRIKHVTSVKVRLQKAEWSLLESLEYFLILLEIIADALTAAGRGAQFNTVYVNRRDIF